MPLPPPDRQARVTSTASPSSVARATSWDHIRDRSDGHLPCCDLSFSMDCSSSTIGRASSSVRPAHRGIDLTLVHRAIGFGPGGRRPATRLTRRRTSAAAELWTRQGTPYRRRRMCRPRLCTFDPATPPATPPTAAPTGPATTAPAVAPAAAPTTVDLFTAEAGWLSARSAAVAKEAVMSLRMGILLWNLS